MAQRGVLNSIDSEIPQIREDSADSSVLSNLSEFKNTSKPMEILESFKHHNDRSFPYELPQLPIEQIEKKLKVQRQISSRHERVDLKDSRESVDSQDLNYQKISISGEETSGVPPEDLQKAASHLIEALQMRENYMRLSYQSFATTPGKFLKNMRGEENAVAVEVKSEPTKFFCKDCGLRIANANKTKHEKMHTKRDSFDDVVPSFTRKFGAPDDGASSSFEPAVSAPWKCYVPDDKKYIIKSVDGVFQVRVRN